MAADTPRITRYRPQSLRLRDSALEQMRAGRWERFEDLLWGSNAAAGASAPLGNPGLDNWALWG